jgi:octaprenyl-diphosphate synthase
VTTPAPSLSTAEQTPFTPERLLAIVAPKLELVEEELRRNFASHVRTINDVADHILEGGGKRLRPIFLLLVAEMLGYQGRRDAAYAAIVEFIHTATLVHDDIIDEAAVRRGRTSINYRWGNQVTVLIGDFLYTHAMNMALREGDLEVLKLLCRVTIEMTEGEVLGLETNGSVALSADDYFDIVGRKTAGLFAATCRIPAHLVGASEAVAQRLFDFGHHLGVGFQLIDDLLDFTSSEEVLGKPVLADLKEGKLTLPLILAMPRATAEEQELIARVAREKSFGDTDPHRILAIAQRYGGVEETRRIARDYIGRAQALLSTFEPSPAREALEFALEFVVARDR